MKLIKTIFVFPVIVLFVVSCTNNENQKCKTDFSLSVKEQYLNDVYKTDKYDSYGLKKAVTEFEKMRQDENVDCESFKTFYFKNIKKKMFDKLKNDWNDLKEAAKEKKREQKEIHRLMDSLRLDRKRKREMDLKKNNL
jgi:hypothetical protein